MAAYKAREETEHVQNSYEQCGEIDAPVIPAKSTQSLNITETITGLKAIQREARKATTSLREAESSALKERLLKHHDKEAILRICKELKQTMGGEGWLIGNIIEEALMSDE